MGLLAPAYDFLTAPLERRALSRWRERTWADVPQRGLGLEIGAGTGANFPYYDAATALSAPIWGEHFNRDAEASVREAGFQIGHKQWLWRDAVVLLVARPRRAMP